MSKGIILSLILILIFLFMGFISTSISFVFLAPIIFTPKNMLDEIFSLMKIKKGDRVLDLGSGDGRLLFHIQNNMDIKNNNIKLFGYDISPILVIYCKLVQILKLRNTTTLDVLNIFDINLVDYDKVYVYLDTKSVNVLDKKISESEKTGIEIFSYRFPFKSLKLINTYTLPNKEKLYKYLH